MDEQDTLMIFRVSSLFLLVLAFQVAIARLSLEREGKRRWQHAISGHMLVQISYLLPLNVSIGALLVGAVGIAYVRWYQPDIYLEVFGPLLRTEERQQLRRLPGAFYFLSGTALTALLFPIDKARYAVECLAFADPMASWMGQVIPSPKFHAKASLAGCTACFFTAVVVGLAYFVPELGRSSSSTGASIHDRHAVSDQLWTVFVGALACTIAEASPFGNDNLLIPLITGATVTYLGANA
ncbi:hypothetical protein ACA910_017365 [Epithemia clementina (nom. ined.)]